jgi:hypothetical protein
MFQIPEEETRNSPRLKANVLKKKTFNKNYNYIHDAINDSYSGYYPFRAVQPPPSRGLYTRQSIFPKNEGFTFEENIHNTIPEGSSQQSTRQLPQIHHPTYQFITREGKKVRRDEDPDQGGGPQFLGMDEGYTFNRHNPMYTYDMHMRKK